jgi:hypothetical protein
MKIVQIVPKPETNSKLKMLLKNTERQLRDQQSSKPSSANWTDTSAIRSTASRFTTDKPAASELSRGRGQAGVRY